MAVTKEQIFSAADELAAAGQRPTLEAIRQITGGSYTTISPALNEWKARQATAAAPLREPAPQAVADRLAELGADVWAVALDLANAELEADRAEATELADKLAGDVEALQSHLALIKAAEAAARGEADELRGQLAAAEARAQEIERRADDLRTELDRAHQDAEQARQALAERLTAAQAERDQAAKATAQAREEAARLAGQIDTLKEQSAALLARITPPAAEAKPATKKKPGGE